MLNEFKKTRLSHHQRMIDEAFSQQAYKLKPLLVQMLKQCTVRHNFASSILSHTAKYKQEHVPHCQVCKLHDGGALQATGRQDLCGMVAGGTTIGWLQTHYEVLYMACVQQNNYPMTSKGQAGCSTRRCSSIRVPARDQHIQTLFESRPDVNQPTYLPPVQVPARRNLTIISRPCSSPGQM